MTTKESEDKKYKTKNPLRKVLLWNFSRSLKRLILSTDAERIGDIGCGAGYLLEEITKNDFSGRQGMKLYSCDIVFKLVKIARQRCPRIYFSVQDIYNPAYRDNSFDLLLCNEVLEHLRCPEEAIKRISALSRKWFIFSVPNEPWFMLSNLLCGRFLFNFGNNPNHINFWTAGSFLKFLRKHFIIHRTSYPFPWMIVMCMKSDKENA
jgi:2-polyprenyl-3-methyl-5-hydroxy-6-metoxy-1,4-benzoquinol methylase